MQTLLDTMVLDKRNVDAYLVAEVDKNQYTEFTFTVTLSPKFTGYLLQAICFWQAFKRAFLWYLPQVIGVLFVACYKVYRVTRVMVRTLRFAYAWSMWSIVLTKLSRRGLL